MPSKRATYSRPAPGEPCQECGGQHVTHRGAPSCMGHVRFDRDPESPTYRARLDQPKPCGRGPITGLDRCSSHGAGNKSAKQAGERKAAEAKARALAIKWGVPIDTTPTEAVLNQVRVWCGIEEFYRAKAAELSDDEKIWGKTREKDGGDDHGTTHEARPHAWLVLHEQASKNVVRFSSEALRAGVEERRVQLAQSFGSDVANVLRAIAARLNLTTEQQATFAEVVPIELRRLAG